MGYLVISKSPVPLLSSFLEPCGSVINFACNLIIQRTSTTEDK